MDNQLSMMYKGLREGQVPFVSISDALPSNAVAQIMWDIYFQPGNTLLIQAAVLRPQIIHSALVLTSQMCFSLPNASCCSPSGQYIPIIEYIGKFLLDFESDK
jgi:hypothetical protein